MIDRDAPLRMSRVAGAGAVPPLRIVGLVALAALGLRLLTGLDGPAALQHGTRTSQLLVTDVTVASPALQGSAEPRWAQEVRTLTVKPVSNGLARAPVAEPEREQSFSTVSVADGRTLVADRMHIRLAGLSLPDPAERCLRLDGRSEPCRERMATQLALMVRWRSVTCRLTQTAPGVAEGSCRVGTSDLVARLTGPAHGLDRVASAPVRLAAAGDVP